MGNLYHWGLVEHSKALTSYLYSPTLVESLAEELIIAMATETHLIQALSVEGEVELDSIPI